jgi:hypothetical protein
VAGEAGPRDEEVGPTYNQPKTFSSLFYSYLISKWSYSSVHLFPDLLLGRRLYVNTLARGQSSYEQDGTNVGVRQASHSEPFNSPVGIWRRITLIPQW